MQISTMKNQRHATSMSETLNDELVHLQRLRDSLILSLEEAKVRREQLQVPPDIPQVSSRKPARRSSLKSSTFEGGNKRSLEKLAVTFSAEAKLHTIPYKSDQDLQRTWLSPRDRNDLQLQCEKDARELRQVLKTHPELDQSPTLTPLSMELSDYRGLEHYASKAIFKSLKTEQADLISAMIGVQELHYHMNSHPDLIADEIAFVSRELSHQCIKRAIEFGQQDERVASAHSWNY